MNKIILTVIANLVCALLVCRAAEVQDATNRPLKLVILGDSTVADYDVSKSALRGWGQMLPEGLKPGLRVVNLAKSGRSTRTFIREGRLASALAEKAGFALIQFGHNDSHGPGRPESTDADTEFKQFLAVYIDSFRNSGTEPVLVTPMHRGTFDKEGRLTQELKPYADAMKDVAKEKKVALIDLHSSSGALFEKLGAAGCADLFSPSDRTHFVEKGARAMAKLVLDGITAQVPGLSGFVAPDIVPSPPAGPE